MKGSVSAEVPTTPASNDNQQPSQVRADACLPMESDTFGDDPV
jgi:hypothetical protein